MGYWIQDLKNVPVGHDWYFFTLGEISNHSMINDFFRDDFIVIAKRIGTNAALIAQNEQMENAFQHLLSDWSCKGVNKERVLLEALEDLRRRSPGLIILNTHPKNFNIDTDTFIYIPFSLLEQKYHSTNDILRDMVSFAKNENKHFIQNILSPTHKNPDVRIINFELKSINIEINNAPEVVAVQKNNKAKKPKWVRYLAIIVSVLAVVSAIITIIGWGSVFDFLGLFNAGEDESEPEESANYSTTAEKSRITTSSDYSPTEEGQNSSTIDLTPPSFSGHWQPPQNPLTIPALRRNVQLVGGWTYFLYAVTDDPNVSDETWRYTALYRFKDCDTELELISDGKCDDFQIAGDSVYYITHNMMNYAGVLYVSRTDGRAQVVLEEWVDKFQIVGQHIYYTHSNQNVGSGTIGHALQRMDLNGNNRMVVAYEVDGPGLRNFDSGSYFRHDFHTDGEYVYGDNYKMRLGFPADGTETLIITGDLVDEYDDEWIFYTTTMLMKSRHDGSQQTILDAGFDFDEDGISDSFFHIRGVDDDWVYYTDQLIGMDYIDGYVGGLLRIRKDGTEKESDNEGRIT